jgi:hypothetical protein
VPCLLGFPMNRLQVEDDLFNRSGDCKGHPVLVVAVNDQPDIALSAKGNAAGLMLRAIDTGWSSTPAPPLRLPSRPWPR